MEWEGRCPLLCLSDFRPPTSDIRASLHLHPCLALLRHCRCRHSTTSEAYSRVAAAARSAATRPPDVATTASHVGWSGLRLTHSLTHSRLATTYLDGVRTYVRTIARQWRSLSHTISHLTHRRRSPICCVCWSMYTLFSCVYAKGVFSIHKITTASNCNKYLGCFVLFPGFCSHRTREYMKNNTRLQGRQSPLNTITHPLFQLGDLAHLGSTVSSPISGGSRIVGSRVPIQTQRIFNMYSNGHGVHSNGHGNSKNI